MSKKCSKCGYFMYGPNPVCPICSGQIKPPKDGLESPMMTLPAQQRVATEPTRVSPSSIAPDVEPASDESPLFSKNYIYVIMVVVVAVVVLAIFYRYFPAFRSDETRSNSYVGRWKEQVSIGGDLENLVDSQNTLVVTRHNADYSIIRNEMDKGKSEVWHGKVSSKGILYAIGNSSNVGDVEINLEKDNRLKMILYANDGETMNFYYRKMLGH
jgi:hypothetical protein